MGVVGVSDEGVEAARFRELTASFFCERIDSIVETSISVETFNIPFTMPLAMDCAVIGILDTHMNVFTSR